MLWMLEPGQLAPARHFHDPETKARATRTGADSGRQPRSVRRHALGAVGAFAYLFRRKPYGHPVDLVPFCRFGKKCDRPVSGDVGPECKIRRDIQPALLVAVEFSQPDLVIPHAARSKKYPPAVTRNRRAGFSDVVVG